MLNVYAASWCPHCRNTVAFLEARKIPFHYYEIEDIPDRDVQKIVEVNGGDDWVVPTLELDGKWRPGATYDEEKLTRDLKEWGVLK